MSLAYAWTLLETGNAAGAEREARRTLAQDPEHIEALFLLGHCRLADDQKAEARHIVERLISIAPEAVFGWRLLGDINAAESVYPAALEAYQRALELDAEDARLHGNLARLYDAWHQDHLAAQHYQKAASLDPDDPYTLINYARFRLKKGLDADELILQAQTLAPDSPDLNLLLGAESLKKGDRAEATDRALWALEQDAGDKAAIILLAQAAASKNPFSRLLLKAHLRIKSLSLTWQWALAGGALLLFILLHQLLQRIEPAWLHTTFITSSVILAVLAFAADTMLEIWANRQIKAIKLKDGF